MTIDFLKIYVSDWLDKYHISLTSTEQLKCLNGEDTRNEVYKCCTTDGATYVVKIFKHPVHAAYDYKSEKNTLDALKNEDIVPMVYYYNDDKLYIVMEYFPKELSLCEFMKTVDMDNDIERMIRYFEAERSLIETLKKNNICDFDKKTEHLFYSEEKNKLKLIDLEMTFKDGTVPSYAFLENRDIDKIKRQFVERFVGKFD